MFACELYSAHIPHQPPSPRALPVLAPCLSLLSLLPSSCISPIVHYLFPGDSICSVFSACPSNTPQPGQSAARTVQVRVPSCSKPPRGSLYPGAEGLKPKSQSEVPVRLIEIQVAGPHPQSFGFTRSEVGLRVCSSCKFPGDAYTAHAASPGMGPHVGKHSFKWKRRLWLSIQALS